MTLRTTFFATEYKYIRYQNEDCLFGNNLHFIISNQNYEDCNEWCINNSTCGGYITIEDNKRCYFKDKSCQNKLYQSYQRIAFIPQGTKVYVTKS